MTAFIQRVRSVDAVGHRLVHGGPHGLRRYGFHGLSYAYATHRAAGLLGRPIEKLHLIMTHLGSGCSATAVREGHSIDTTMGFTPLEGLVMGSRSGTVDPGMLLWLQREGVTHDHLEDGLQRRSADRPGRAQRHPRAGRRHAHGRPICLPCARRLAHSARRGLAAVAASLTRIDALVFTGEIGWDQPEVREAIAGGLGVWASGVG